MAQETREITFHGNRLSSLALDPSGTALVTGDRDGTVRVGPLTGEEPHLLFGHSGSVWSVAVSPDGRWIASGSEDGTFRLWAMPDLSKPPLYTLPHAELLAKLRSLTNLRAVPDPVSDTGWKVDTRERDGRIEIEPAITAMNLVSRPGGCVAVPEQELPPLTDEMVRDALERVRR